MGLTGFEECKRVPHESARGLRNHGCFQRGIESVRPDNVEKLRDRSGICTHLAHGHEIKVKVARMGGILTMGLWQPVAFLADHDVVDQAYQIPMGTWHPGPGGRCKLRLQKLEQGHEIPHREDMMLHEDAELLLRLHDSEERVGFNRLEGGPQGIGQLPFVIRQRDIHPSRISFVSRQPLISSHKSRCRKNLAAGKDGFDCATPRPPGDRRGEVIIQD